MWVPLIADLKQQVFFLNIIMMRFFTYPDSTFHRTIFDPPCWLFLWTHLVHLLYLPNLENKSIEQIIKPTQLDNLVHQLWGPTLPTH